MNHYEKQAKVKPANSGLKQIAESLRVEYEELLQDRIKNPTQDGVNDLVVKGEKL